MKLTPKNIKRWKKKLDRRAARMRFLVMISDSLSDLEWLELYEGETPKWALAMEMEGYSQWSGI